MFYLLIVFKLVLLTAAFAYTVYILDRPSSEHIKGWLALSISFLVCIIPNAWILNLFL